MVQKFHLNFGSREQNRNNWVIFTSHELLQIRDEGVANGSYTLSISFQMVRKQHYWDRKWSINSFDVPPSIFITSLNHNSYYLFSWVFMKMVHPIIWPYMIWFIFNLGWNIPQLESTFPSLQPLNRWHFKLSTVSSKRMTENHSNLEFEQNGPIITHN